MTNESIPADKGLAGGPVWHIGDRTYKLEVACTYKLTQILGLLAKVSDEIKLPELLLSLRPADGTAPDATKLFVAVLPHLFTRIPDTVLHAVGLFVIPNEELKGLYKTPNAIAERVDSEVEWLQFNAHGDDVVILATLCVRLLGIEALKNALPLLMAAVNKSLGATQPQ